MGKETVFDWIVLALKFAGVRPHIPDVDSYYPGFSIAYFSGGKSAEGLLGPGFKVSANGLYEPNALGEERERYVEALKAFGLTAKLCRIDGFVGAYVPLEQQEASIGESMKVQVEFRVTMYGQPVAHALRHDVLAELTIVSGHDSLGWKATGKAPRNCRGSERFFVGRGLNIAASVIDWLSNLDRSMDYVSAHKVLEEKDREARLLEPLEPRADL